MPWVSYNIDANRSNNISILGFDAIGSHDNDVLWTLI